MSHHVRCHYYSRWLGWFLRVHRENKALRDDSCFVGVAIIGIWDGGKPNTTKLMSEKSYKTSFLISSKFHHSWSGSQLFICLTGNMVSEIADITNRKRPIYTAWAREEGEARVAYHRSWAPFCGAKRELATTPLCKLLGQAEMSCLFTCSPKRVQTERPCWLVLFQVRTKCYEVQAFKVSE